MSMNTVHEKVATCPTCQGQDWIIAPSKIVCSRCGEKVRLHNALHATSLCKWMMDRFYTQKNPAQPKPDGGTKQPRNKN